MIERSEAREECAVHDAAPDYLVQAEAASAEAAPRGYKRAAVGLVPEDWETKRFGDVLERKNLKSNQVQTVDYRDSGNYPVVDQGQEAVAGFTDRDDKVFYCPTTGVIVFGDHTCIVKFVDFHFAVGADGTQVLEAKSGQCTRFYAYQLEHNGVKPTGYNRHFKFLKEKSFPVPEKKEQTAIATTLSDADALVASLDRLMAKKRGIKQAVMQQLLTGQTRLPGFTGKWETKRLGEIGTFYKGHGIRRDDVSDEGVPCVRYGEIYTRYDDCVVDPESRISVGVAQSAFPLRPGDILFAGSGETSEEIGMCVAYLGEEPAFAGGDIVVLRPNEGVSAYLGRLLNHPSIAQQKARLGQGDAVVHISARNLAQIEVQLPPVEEQTAIATVLSDMDTEIEALERRRDKARQIKQGMMQQLLSGRVRLVKPEPAEPAAC